MTNTPNTKPVVGELLKNKNKKRDSGSHTYPRNTCLHKHFDKHPMYKLRKKKKKRIEKDQASTAWHASSLSPLRLFTSIHIIIIILMVRQINQIKYLSISRKSHLGPKLKFT